MAATEFCNMSRTEGLTANRQPKVWHQAHETTGVRDSATGDLSRRSDRDFGRSNIFRVRHFPIVF